MAEEITVGVKVMDFYEIKLDPANDRIIVGKNFSSFKLHTLRANLQSLRLQSFGHIRLWANDSFLGKVGISKFY